MSKKIAVVGLAAKAEVGFADTPSLVVKAGDVLKNTGMDVFTVDKLMYDYASAERVAWLLTGDDVDVILVCVGTWSDDNYVLQFLKAVNKPVIFHAFPHMESGSLCGVMQIGSVFKDIGFDAYKTVYAAPGSQESKEKILEACDELLKGKSDKVSEETFYIGSIGGRVPGMTEIAFDEFALYEKCGALIATINETELLREVKKISNIDVIKVREKLIDGKGYHIDSDDEAIKESLKYYLAMKALIKKYGLKGLAVKCYTEYMGKVCLGYSLLSDEGYACSCEGDVNSAIMMKILMDITGTCVNNTDILNPLPETNEIIFAHCGSSGFSIAPCPDEVHIKPVRIMEQGACSVFRPKLGKVTAADLVGHGDTLRMSVMVGEAVEKEYLFPGNQACIRFDRPVVDICEDVIKYGCGHHWMVGYGDVSEQLKQYCESRNIIYQKLT